MLPSVHVRHGAGDAERFSDAVKYITHSPVGARATLGSWLKDGHTCVCVCVCVCVVCAYAMCVYMCMCVCVCVG